jgi:hypothetical protein
MISFEAHEIAPLIGQNERIQAALLKNGVVAELVLNKLDEPIAVVARDFMNPDQLTHSLLLEDADQQVTLIQPSDLGNTLPLSGTNIYPESFLSIMDLVVNSAAQQNGLASNLMSPTRHDTDRVFSTAPQSFGLHIDLAGGNGLIEPNLALSGLNIHYTRWGSYDVRLGALRSLENEECLSRIIKSINKKQATRTDLLNAYEALAAPFTDPVSLKEGDLLFFQGRQHGAAGIVAVAHEFVTTSSSRRSDVFRPQLGSHKDVQERREFFAKLFQFPTY